LRQQHDEQVNGSGYKYGPMFGPGQMQTSEGRRCARKGAPHPEDQSAHRGPEGDVRIDGHFEPCIIQAAIMDLVTS
jgi:hypothetical protein